VGSGLLRAEAVTVHWPADGAQPRAMTREMYVAGTLGGADCLRTLADYVHAVARFRAVRQPDKPELSMYARVGSIFVSHASQDRAWCAEFIHRLRLGGASGIWYDELSLGAGELSELIQDAIADRPVFVVVLSPAAVASPWVAQEVEVAIELAAEDPQHRKILPVLAAPCTIPPALDPFVRVRGPGDTGLSPEEAARQVLEVLTRPVA
jgi:hypothetical protein